jgi:hypothetical protein
MRCPHCGITLADPPFGERHRRHVTDMMRVVGALPCARCGERLNPTDQAETMLTKLTQLSQFGLGADDRPVLTQEPPVE